MNFEKMKKIFRPDPPSAGDGRKFLQPQVKICLIFGQKFKKFKLEPQERVVGGGHIGPPKSYVADFFQKIFFLSEISEWKFSNFHF